MRQGCHSAPLSVRLLPNAKLLFVSVGGDGQFIQLLSLTFHNDTCKLHKCIQPERITHSDHRTIVIDPNYFTPQ